MSKLVREHTGHGYVWHLDSYRMPEAARLLRETTRSVKDIGCEVGYSGLKHVERRFREWYGMTPSAYRQTLARVSAASRATTDLPMKTAS